MERDVWILGASMTKFQRYPDKDLIDLGSEAALGALDDAGVTIQDMDVMGAGNLAEAASGVGQRVQKQIGQTGIPVYNVANACATGATAVRCAYLAIKAGEAEMGLAVGLEKMGKAGLLGATARSDKKVFEPAGRAVVLGSAQRGMRGPDVGRRPRRLFSGTCEAEGPVPGLVPRLPRGLYS